MSEWSLRWIGLKFSISFLLDGDARATKEAGHSMRMPRSQSAARNAEASKGFSKNNMVPVSVHRETGRLRMTMET